MLEQTEYTPDELFISAPVTARATIKTGVSFPARTPLMVDATDAATLVKWDGTPGKAIAISARDVTNTGSDQESTVYLQGGFRIGFFELARYGHNQQAKTCCFPWQSSFRRRRILIRRFL